MDLIPDYVLRRLARGKIQRQSGFTSSATSHVPQGVNKSGARARRFPEPRSRDLLQNAFTRVDHVDPRLSATGSRPARDSFGRRSPGPVSRSATACVPHDGGRIRLSNAFRCAGVPVAWVAWLHPRVQLLLVSADDHRLWSVPGDAPVVHDHRGREWLDALPVLVAARCRQWDLHVDGDPLHGSNALVVRSVAASPRWHSGWRRRVRTSLRRQQPSSFGPVEPPRVCSTLPEMLA